MTGIVTSIGRTGSKGFMASSAYMQFTSLKPTLSKQIKMQLCSSAIKEYKKAIAEMIHKNKAITTLDGFWFKNEYHCLNKTNAPTRGHLLHRTLREEMDQHYLNWQASEQQAENAMEYVNRAMLYAKCVEHFICLLPEQLAQFVIQFWEDNVAPLPWNYKDRFLPQADIDAFHLKWETAEQKLKFQLTLNLLGS